MNIPRLKRFIKYLVIMLLSLEFVALIIIVALNLGALESVVIFVVMGVVSSIIAARDAGYISLF